ncbi:MAG: hypothetical protein GY804_15020 [Alphaproteobacteria bacterium]|nr:hypothetical protein [Alphaproteobacteria bacterium]
MSDVGKIEISPVSVADVARLFLTKERFLDAMGAIYDDVHYGGKVCGSCSICGNIIFKGMRCPQCYMKTDNG